MESNKKSKYYIGDFGNGLYHESTCSMIEHIIHKIRFDSITEAEADGYVPHICIPRSSTTLSPKVIMHRLPTQDELRELTDLGWREIQSGKYTKYKKLIGKGLNNITVSDMKEISSDLIKYGLRVKGKQVID